MPTGARGSGRPGRPSASLIRHQRHQRSSRRPGRGGAPELPGVQQLGHVLPPTSCGRGARSGRVGAVGCPGPEVLHLRGRRWYGRSASTSHPRRVLARCCGCGAREPGRRWRCSWRSTRPPTACRAASAGPVRSPMPWSWPTVQQLPYVVLTRGAQIRVYAARHRGWGGRAEPRPSSRPT